MISYEEAFEVAQRNHFDSSHILTGRAQTDEFWIFYYGEGVENPVPGNYQRIAVSKEDGSWHDVAPLSEEFFLLMDTAKAIE